MSKATSIVIAVIAVALILLGALGFFFFSSEKANVAYTAPVEEGKPKGTPVHAVIGTSVEKRSIDAYTFGEGKTELLFVGGMHGGYEWNSVLLAYTMMDHFEAHPDIIPANVKVTVIPSLNPDGVFRIIGKAGRFNRDDVPKEKDTAPGRFNAHEVDLNRNFDCNWKPESMWRSKVVSAGTAPFSEPESKALRDYVAKHKPAAAIFWHSQSNAVYASECKNGILPATLKIMDAYAKAAKYPAVKTFDSYAVTGDAEGWLASINIPAITVELSTHETIEWERNLSGVEALFQYYRVTVSRP